jgi:cation-transporting ATPase 13A1
MLTAYRCQKWESISSELIVPGDIISLTSLPSRKSRKLPLVFLKRDKVPCTSGSEPDDEVIMPCDALLVGGSCVVNEALLTGESVPQMKESITDTNCQSSDSLNLNADSMSESSWRRHVLLAGTCLLQHSPYNAEDENNAKSLKEDEFRIAPDGGCVAVVVRTGFGTVQVMSTVNR